MKSSSIVNKSRKNCNPLKIISDAGIHQDPIDVASWIRFIREMKIPKNCDDFSWGCSLCQ